MLHVAPLCFGLALLCGCASAPPVYVTSSPRQPQVVPYAGRIPTEAPRESLVRCESLASPAIQPGPVKPTDLIIEIEKSRRAYVECAIRHNELILQYDALKSGYIDLFNHYYRQLPR